MQVSIDEILIGQGRRSLDSNHVKKLADSIGELGLLNPVTIDQGNHLIAGLHRLEAARLLGWEKVECNVCSLDGLQAELAEIDENIIRSGLPAIEYGEMLLRRKEIYESIHPETRHGGDRKSREIKCAKSTLDTAKSFVDDTAEKLKVNPCTVRRQLQTARNLTQEAKEIMKSTDAPISKKAAMKLSRLEPVQQKEAAELLAAQKIRTVDEYVAGVGKMAAEEEPPFGQSAVNADRSPENHDMGEERQEGDSIDDTGLAEDVLNVLDETRRQKDVFLHAGASATENILKGLLICEDCGTKMMRYKSVSPAGTARYVFNCKIYAENLGGQGCSLKSVGEPELKECILQSLQVQIRLAMELERMLERLEKNPKFREKGKGLSDRKKQLQQKIRHNISLRGSLYESLSDHTLTETEYLSLKRQYEGEAERLRRELEEAEEQERREIKALSPQNKWIAVLKKYQGERKTGEEMALTRQMAVELIKCIRVSGYNEVEIIWNFQDEFARLVQEAERFGKAGETDGIRGIGKEAGA